MDSRSTEAERARREHSPGVARSLVHAQRLVDSRPHGPYQVAWCAEAMHVGDSTALLMLELARRAG